MSKGKSEGGPHRDVKYYLAKTCSMIGLDYHTEAVFMDNSRCDFLVENWGIIFEVLSSESLKDFSKKKYPFPSIPLPSTMKESEVIMMMSDLNALNGDGFEYYIRKFS